MPETGAAIGAWLDSFAAAGAADAAVAETAAGAAAAGGAAELGAGMALADEAGAGLSTGLADAGGTTAASSSAEGIIPGSGEAATPLAETPAASPTQTAAQELINGPAEVGQGQPLAEEAGGAGPGLQEPPQPGIVDRIMSGADQFATKHPIAAGQAVSGVGKAALGTLSASQKRKADLEALAARHGYDIDLAGFKQRQTQANPSVGGGPVNLNLAPGKDVLRRPDGTPVFTPGTGIINGSMNGTRG